MDELVVQMFAQLPTVAGLVYLAITLRAELKTAREEAKDANLFIQKLLLVLMNQPGEEEQSRARSVLRSRIENP